ncbi:uncharacterized protein LOC132725814 [Ruditapes philippinarum]|uniref:uncharacterized protein LOC132725814 n=1 Tax=Ruditapes philippinarum TaxID=129788 RepID=UPI00295ABCA4|nr:uncharacterized protein LOC132725814 [Ruditapes philippinarum]
MSIRPSIIFVVLALLPSCLSECRFPDFLQTQGEGPSWFVTYHNKEVSISVNHTKMIIKECRNKGHVQCQEYERHCAVPHGGSRFLVREYVKDRSTYETEITYRCIQFLRRSKSVVQVRITLYNAKDSSDSLCNENHLVLDQYPMISREHATEVNECPAIGGYDFKLYHYGEQTPLCDDIFLPLRIESDCTHHEGIKLYFRRRNCSNLFVGRDLKIDPLQAEPVEIRCVASWQYNKYTFAIVKWRGTPKFWCIRVTYLNDKIDEMYVYFSGICPSNNKNYERMLILKHFKTHYVTGICADQNMKCSYHHCSTYKDKCKLSCALCEPEMEEKSCSFPHAYYGRWNSLHPTTSALEITNDTLTYNNMKWECVESKSNNRLEIFGRHALKLKFSNGCYPRYMCTEIEHPTTSVIRYRTGKELFWPIDSIDDVCEERFFDYRPTFAETSGIARTSGPWVYFIKDSPEYVNCNLPWYIKNSAFFEMYDNKNQLANQGCLSYDNESPGHVLQLYYTYQNLQQEWNVQTQKTFVCIASIKIIGENDVLITHNIDEGVYMCWTFVQDRYRNYVYIFNAKNCGNGTNKQLVFFSAQKYIAMLVLRKNSTVCDLIGNKDTIITRRSDDALSNLTENNIGSLAFRPHLAISLLLYISLMYNLR